MADRLVAPLFAHQGGWDEFLFAAGPILLIGGLLWLANKRAKQLGRPDASDILDAGGDVAGDVAGDVTSAETRD